VFSAFCGDLFAIGKDSSDLSLDRVGVEGARPRAGLPVPEELLGRVILRCSRSAAMGEFAQLNIYMNGRFPQQQTWKIREA
jgi:hypothetical protein